MRVVACDIGTHHTGLALGDATDGTVVALDPLSHVSREDLLLQLKRSLDERSVKQVVLGLPLLPGGGEGKQTEYVRIVGKALEEDGFSVSYLDERYSSKGDYNGGNGDTKAACDLLLVYLSRGFDNSQK